jgi:hypothetical protein
MPTHENADKLCKPAYKQNRCLMNKFADAVLKRCFR